jgi:Skp family chaperone for outer membrane proteins
MKSAFGWIVAVVVSGGLVLSVLYGGSQINPAPLKVGVVDLAKVIDGYQKKKDREADLAKARDTASAQLKALQKKIESMNSEIDLLDKKSAEYLSKKRELLEKQEELLMRSRLADREVQEKLEQYLQEVYSEILGRIEEYRAANKFDLIFRQDPRPLTTQERIVYQLDRKVLMASDKSFDVTDDLIVFLNQSYAK